MPTHSSHEINSKITSKMVCHKRITLSIGLTLVVALCVSLSIFFVINQKKSDGRNTQTGVFYSFAAIQNDDARTRSYKNVSTHCGKVEGLAIPVNADSGHSATVYEFKNIPYAVPPTKERRWKPPLRMSREKSTCWNGTLKYNSKKTLCPLKRRLMGPIEGQEDCLVLDIRTPSLQLHANLPVFVWIHGGAMLWSHKSEQGYHPNPQFTSSMNAVTVSVNFRLNVFGFLSLEELWIKSGNETSYGNYGLMDLILSLKWIRENIQNFGGNKNQVTLFGHSGGGTACYALLGSPPAKGLFHKIVSVSGSPNIRVNHLQANQLYRQFITKTKCDRSTKAEVRRCLENLSVETALNNSPWISPMVPGVPSLFTNLLTYKLYFPMNVPNIGYPVEILDPVVITKSPSDITSSQISGPVDIILASVAEELPVFPPVQLTDDYSSLRYVLEPRILSFKNASYNEAYLLYTQKKNFEIQSKQLTPLYLYSIMGSDVLGNCITNDIVEQYSSISGYRSYRLVTSQPPTATNDKPTQAYHGWDIRALFGFQEYPGYKPTTDEITLLQNLRKVYKSFIHSDNSFAITYSNKTIVMQENNIKLLHKSYHAKQCQFWRQYGFYSHSWGNLGQ